MTTKLMTAHKQVCMYEHIEYVYVYVYYALGHRWIILSLSVIVLYVCFMFYMLDDLFSWFRVYVMGG